MTTRVTAAPSTKGGMEDSQVIEKKGKGSATAQRANAKAAKESEKDSRKSSAAQAELGRKGGEAAKKS